MATGEFLARDSPVSPPFPGEEEAVAAEEEEEDSDSVGIVLLLIVTTSAREYSRYPIFGNLFNFVGSLRKL